MNYICKAIKYLLFCHKTQSQILDLLESSQYPSWKHLKKTLFKQKGITLA